MTLKVLGTTLLAATGVCGTAAVWSHARQAGPLSQRGHSRRGQFSHRDHGEARGDSRLDSNVARDFMPRRMQDARAWGDQTWQDRGR
jgi:hypothetical protein